MKVAKTGDATQSEGFVADVERGKFKEARIQYILYKHHENLLQIISKVQYEKEIESRPRD